MKKRFVSDEQKARSAERREKFASLCKQLAEMSDAERIKLCASVGAVLTCEGRQLSDINTALLVMQYGGRVSVVGGFRQWKKAGRYVMKGQHGASIWIPKSKGEAPADEGKREGEISGRELAAASEGRRFFLGTVFDILQTCEIGQDDTRRESPDNDLTEMEAHKTPADGNRGGISEGRIGEQCWKAVRGHIGECEIPREENGQVGGASVAISGGSLLGEGSQGSGLLDLEGREIPERVRVLFPQRGERGGASDGVRIEQGAGSSFTPIGSYVHEQSVRESCASGSGDAQREYAPLQLVEVESVTLEGGRE